MKNMNRTMLIVILIAATISFAFSFEKELPLTIAETTNYKSTSRYDDVIKFIKSLQKQSSNIKVETICTSAEGRSIPLLIIGDPAPNSPLELRNDSRGVLYIQANIHAGEVEGKEACLMLVRDILLKENLPFLKNLVILIAPIFNADGNEKISTDNRRTQNGPVNGVGVRYNGQNLDLNRDGIKLESPEVQGLVKNVLNRWDPFLLVDCHTTNGSFHEEPVTYTWGFNPNGSQSVIDLMRLKMMPFIQQNMKAKYNVISILFGDFMDSENPEKGWSPAGPEVRYLTNYVGLRNRLSILNENYTYSDFKTRIWGCYYFLISVLEFCDINKNEIIKMVYNADQKTIQRGLNPSKTDSFIVEYDLQPYDEKVTILGYEMTVTPRENGWPKVEKTDVKRTYHVPYYCKYVAKRSVRFPHAYLLPQPPEELIQKLVEHGITIEQLLEPVTLEVESFQIDKIEADKDAYQGHHLNSINGKYIVEKREFPKGTLFVGTAQPLGSLIAYLLEPESGDGLLAWNFFDRYLFRQWSDKLNPYPVYRLMESANIVKQIIKE